MSSTSPLVYTGGPLATHAYLFPLKELLMEADMPTNDVGERDYLCFDAPEGLLEFVQAKGLRIRELILTHGHFDHSWDAQKIARAFGCRVHAHPGDFVLLQDPGVFQRLGFEFAIEPVEELTALPVPEQGAADLEIAGVPMRGFHIPGHSTGSVAFYLSRQGLVVGGDVLFSGGVGRWDLPLGSKETLLAGIRRHLLPLPGGTIVYPGHGPATTIGHEARTNPYLAGSE